MKHVSRTDIVRQVSILSIAEKFGISLESISAGNFDYRCPCPSEDHKSGKEKTSSLHVNSTDNDFWCFGCHKGTSCIDFYMICSGKTFSEAMQDLKDLVKTPGAYHDVVDQKKIVFPVLIRTSEIIREFLINNPEQLPNITNLLKKVDKISFDTAKEDPDKIEEMNIKLKKIFWQGK